ncbi:pyruvate, phosphate dikinase [Erythrobacter sp.]|uniref:pyruvate, phosphate dikinase n=1 Tax=Erythrobacter sp. TaxID=1042 RepID=UPI001B15748F|nr:pyruvate, phosphate dikinase [Erythrobacter sp.]MBO6525425.1 pyruvate, phosphate dikinase [Erythrobacter sp.]MBO6529902.1 pyruvate, phosphate dikinase [Erythrobacter sp.]
MILPLDATLEAGPDRIGGKAASLLSMARLGLQVPPAFVVPTDVGKQWAATGQLPENFAAQLMDGMRGLEALTGRRFGGAEKPLLISVRSGAAISMPGMMETLLNLGLTKQSAAGLAKETGDPEFVENLKASFEAQFTACVGPVPETAQAQLIAAVEAVLSSWNSRRARRYRAHHDIPDDLGTAVAVQAMVFGNMCEQSGTGVLFSRNPITGDAEPWGEWLPRAQGEALVAGTHNAEPLEQLAKSMPQVHAELLEGARALEQAGRDAQDIEFTIEAGRLFFLQSRAAKRTANAALNIAMSMYEEGLIDRAEALSRVTPEQLATMLSPVLSEPGDAPVVASGTPASPGAGVGVAVTSAQEAERIAGEGRDVVLVRPTTSPDDVGGMLAAAAVVTEAGGATSHAAVVGRALGKPVVSGCGPGLLAALAGRDITVCGTSGRVFDGALSLEKPAPPPGLERYRNLAAEAGDAARLAALAEQGGG